LITQQVMVVGVLAIGMTLIILTAGIDLSCGMVMALGSMVMTKLAVEQELPVGLAILCGIGVTCLFGLINGLLVTKAKLPSFIVTLGTMNIAFATTQIYTSSASVTDLPESLTMIGNTFEVFGTQVSWGTLFMVFLYLVMWRFLSGAAYLRGGQCTRGHAAHGYQCGQSDDWCLCDGWRFLWRGSNAHGGAHGHWRSTGWANREFRCDHSCGAWRHIAVWRARHYFGLTGRRIDRRRVSQRAHADGRALGGAIAGHGCAGDFGGGCGSALA
jgi:Branched-chain amino acid transport system / permease component